MELEQFTQSDAVRTLQRPMTMYELLAGTNAPDNGDTRVELVELPKDPALNDRYALVVCGPLSEKIVDFLTWGLEQLGNPQVAASIAAQKNGTQSHGSESRG